VLPEVARIEFTTHINESIIFVPCIHRFDWDLCNMVGQLCAGTHLVYIGCRGSMVLNLNIIL